MFKVTIMFEILPIYYVGMLTFIVNYITNVLYVKHRMFEYTFEVYNFNCFLMKITNVSNILTFFFGPAFGRHT